MWQVATPMRPRPNPCWGGARPGESMKCARAPGGGAAQVNKTSASSTSCYREIAGCPAALPGSRAAQLGNHREFVERRHGIGRIHQRGPPAHVDGHPERFFDFLFGGAQLDECL